MAWFSSNISLGNFADLAGGAVNKLQESVKSIEKNFDNALGFEDKEKAESSSEASGLWTAAADRKTLFNPVMSFIGQRDEESDIESSQKSESLESAEAENTLREDESSKDPSISKETKGDEKDVSAVSVADTADEYEHPKVEVGTDAVLSHEKDEVEKLGPSSNNVESTVLIESLDMKEMPEVGDLNKLEMVLDNSRAIEVDQVEGVAVLNEHDHSYNNTVVHEDMHEHYAEADRTEEHKTEDGDVTEASSTLQDYGLRNANIVDTETLHDHAVVADAIESGEIPSNDGQPSSHPLNEASEGVPETAEQDVNNANSKVDEEGPHVGDIQKDIRSDAPDIPHSSQELEKVKREVKMMENALLGAAKQAQAKADEIAKLMNENEQLKGVVEDLKRKPSDLEVETLREEYHQRVSTLERKVYALTKERDTLRREQNKKSDAALLLKEKDEIINQVMAEGEELSKKQAAQEAQMRKLRAQIRELEEEKKGLATKLQVEENKVDSIKKDKSSTEKLLQETIERHQSELALQKEFYANALAAAKEAEALAEARANNEARSELESRLREAEERESMLVQAIEELRQTLNRKEQQAVFKEDMHKREIEDMQRRYQASERRCEELITQVPDSTRPLLRQIEAMQETIGRRAEAWAAVERSLNSRLQEAEAKSAAAEERERSANERLSQTLSRINVLEAQISCLRTEQTQLSKSLEKERQRAAENRQEYLVMKEEADTQEGRASQLEEELREMKRKHKQDLHEVLINKELLQQELEKEKAARLDLERTARAHSASVSDQPPMRQNSTFENGSLSGRLSSASSLGSMEESYYLQASLDSADSYSERRNAGEATISPYYMKSMTPGAFESALRQKEGELASYMSRLASMEAIRDSLAEELVKMTEQCEKLRGEAATVPGIKAELESLRRRHSAALELMGERDEELEELRADIIDLKEMYREQVNLLVNKIQILGS